MWPHPGATCDCNRRHGAQDSGGGGGAALAAIGGVLVLGDHLSALESIGIVCIVGGLALAGGIALLVLSRKSKI